MKTQAHAVVLVEEDEVTLELYQRELGKTFIVFAFNELKGVMETIAAQDIRAVIIEPEILSGKGWELIHSIHESFPDRCIPVIICSTRDTHTSNLAGEVAKYLTKPVLPKTLREKTLEVVVKMSKLREAS